MELVSGALVKRASEWRHQASRPIIAGVGYLMVLTAAELLTALANPRVGLILHGCLLVVLLIHSALTWHQPTEIGRAHV